MIQIHRTRGIVLDIKDLKEQDKLITVLTENGKLKLKGKGMKKSSAKLAPYFQLFNLVNIEIAKGKKFDLIIGVQLENSFLNLKKDLSFLFYGFYFLELVNKLIEEEISDPKGKELFDLLLECLNYLDELKKDILPLVLVYFQLKLTKILGYAPQFENCIKCGKDNLKEKNLFSFELGGVLCEKCRNNREGILISDKLRETGTYILENEFSQIFSSKINNELLKKLNKLMQIFIKYHLGDKEIKSVNFLEYANFL